MASDKLAKIEQLLKGIRRDAEGMESEFETADQIARTAGYALDLLEEFRLESDESATDDLSIPLAA